jgi:hypothetical protein
VTQIPLLSGIKATERADFSLSYPVNLEPVPIETGLSKGYLRSAAGAASIGTGPGIDRGGIVWNGTMYRVMGSKLVTVSTLGVVVELGDVGAGAGVKFERFDAYLAVRSGTALYYWNGTTLAQVTDPDLGACLDIARLSGQLFSTDGKYIIAAQLADPTQIDPLKYGAAESDPDSITGLQVTRNELYACGQFTIDVFSYVGGSGFPLQLSPGATIPYGVCGALAKINFAQTFAFVGSAEGEALGVWLAGGGSASKLSTRAIDDLLAAELNPAAIQMEKRVSRDEQRLYVHLSDKTLVYLHTASNAAQQAVWYIAGSGLGMEKAYRPRNAVLLNGKWIVGDKESSAIGLLDDADASHFGEAVGWQFDTLLFYNGAKGAIVHTLELVGLPGRASGTPVAYLSFTSDGETWTMERAKRLGGSGQRAKRTQWSPHKRMSNYLGCRFRGDSEGLAGWAALEAEIEGLAV